MRAVLVTGDRNAGPEWLSAMHRVLIVSKGDIVIHGAARGIDTLAGQFALERGAYPIAMPAQWHQFKGLAGPRRNRAMLRVLLELKDHGYMVSVVAFHHDLQTSKGTRNMVEHALSQGVKTFYCWGNGVQELDRDYFAAWEGGDDGNA